MLNFPRVEFHVLNSTCGILSYIFPHVKFTFCICLHVKFLSYIFLHVEISYYTFPTFISLSCCIKQTLRVLKVINLFWTKLRLSDGKVLDTILGNVDGITIGIDFGTELVFLDGSFHGSSDIKIEGLLFGHSKLSTDVKTGFY